MTKHVSLLPALVYPILAVPGAPASARRSDEADRIRESAAVLSEIKGSSIRQDRDANDRFYGVAHRTCDAVPDGRAAPRPAIDVWFEALARHVG